LVQSERYADELAYELDGIVAEMASQF
jgi:hypothetical protein